MRKICNKCYGYGEISHDGKMCSWCSGKDNFDTETHETHETHDREESVDLCPLCGCCWERYDEWAKNYGKVLLDKDIQTYSDFNVDLDLHEKVLMTLVMVKETGDYSKIDELIDALRIFLEGVEKDSAEQLALLIEIKETINGDEEE
jgi:tRNA U54 and U55 pseudouridine synthase Pus10